MRSRIFTIITIILILCGCSGQAETEVTTAIEIEDEEQIVSTITGELSVDAQYYGTFECVQRGMNIEIEKEGKVVAVIENAEVYSRDINKDGKSIALSVLPDGSGEFGEKDFSGFSIYYYKDELIHIADNTMSMLLGEDGKTIAYNKNVDVSKFIDGDFEGYRASLCDYYIWNDNESVFLWNKNADSFPILSPDCTDIYYKEQKDSYDDYYYDLYLYNNGDPVLAVVNTTDFVVSNNSEYFYGAADGSFFVQTGLNGEHQVLAHDDEIESFSKHYNADGSQVIFSVDEATYLSVNGGKAKKIADARFDNILAPPLCPKDSLLYPIVEDFAGSYIHTTDNCIYKITEDYDAELVLSNVFKAEMADDGDTIVYTTGDYDTENKIATTKLSDPSNPVIFTPNETPLNELSWGRFVTIFEVSYDGKTVYYATEDCDLYMLRDGEKTLIDNDIGFMSDFGNARVYNNDDLYYIKDGDNAVYRFDGMESVKVKTFLGETTYIRKDGGTLEVTVKFMSGSRYYRTYDGETFFTR
jgi:PBP1b-binding outer membrane lipoprotein LpoB